MKHKTPKTNNAGHARISLDEKQILKHPTYSFRSAVIRKFMGPAEFEEFVKKYCDNRKLYKFYQPTKSQLKAFNAYTQGKLSIEALQIKLHVKTTASLFFRIGKLYDYTRKVQAHQ